jgi:DNA-binding NarL/FixJ family response regulator
MKKSVLNNKWVLVVDNQPGVLIVLEEELRRVAPNCHVDKATRYKNAVELMASFTYDLVILDSLSFRSSDLLRRAVDRFPLSPVVLMTSPYLDSEVLKGFVKIGARICPPKENFGEMIPFLEDVIRHEDFPGWRRLLQDLTGPFRGKIKTGWQGRSRFEIKSVGRAGSIS